MSIYNIYIATDGPFEGNEGALVRVAGNGYVKESFVGW